MKSILIKWPRHMCLTFLGTYAKLYLINLLTFKKSKKRRNEPTNEIKIDGFQFFSEQTHKSVT